MANLTKVLAGLFAPKAVSDILDNQNPRELGKDAGEWIREVVVNQIGEKPYSSLSGKLISWVDAFYVELRKVLL